MDKFSFKKRGKAGASYDGWCKPCNVKYAIMNYNRKRYGDINHQPPIKNFTIELCKKYSEKKILNNFYILTSQECEIIKQRMIGLSLREIGKTFGYDKMVGKGIKKVRRIEIKALLKLDKVLLELSETSDNHEAHIKAYTEVKRSIEQDDLRWAWDGGEQIQISLPQWRKAGKTEASFHKLPKQQGA
jgi:hypothetical protein